MTVRRGFTLVEVMLALVIGGMIVLMAHALFGAASELAARLGERHASNDRRANARRFLIAALTSASVGDAPSGSFNGDSSQLAFTSWFVTASGRQERRDVTVRQAGIRLLATAGADTLLLASGVISVDFDYLLDFGSDAAWVREWHSPVTLPIALRARIARRGAEATVDTILVALGPRG